MQYEKCPNMVVVVFLCYLKHSLDSTLHAANVHFLGNGENNPHDEVKCFGGGFPALKKVTPFHIHEDSLPPLTLNKVKSDSAEKNRRCTMNSLAGSLLLSPKGPLSGVLE